MKRIRLCTIVVLFVAALPSRAADLLHEFRVSPGTWRARDAAEVGIAREGEDGTVFRVRQGSSPWVIVDGPEISLEARSKFFKNRRVRVDLEAKAAGLPAYAMQIRFRQRERDQKEGGAWTRNLSPRRVWETGAEIGQADRFADWTEIEGVSQVARETERLAMELWIAVPTDAEDATLQLRNIRVSELAEVEHEIASEPQTLGNIFFSDEGVLKAEFVDADALESCRIEIYDERESLVGKVEGGAGTGTLAIPLKNRGYYSVHASADYHDGRTITASTSAAVVGEPLDPEIRRASRFGAVRVWGNGDLWLKSGANWDWGIGGIDLSGYAPGADGKISPPAGAAPLTYPEGYRTVYTVGRFPRWVMPETYSSSSLTPPRDWAQFERLFEAFARQNPDLPWFCPFNEPDAHWRGDEADFVKFHQAIAVGVKKGNPAMKVLGPCLYSIRMDALKRYASLGLLDSLDGLVMHAYVDGTPPEGQFIRNVVEMAEFLKQSGKGEMPVYITEYGWCSGRGDWQKTIPEIERSRYAARSLALLATQPLDAIEYFSFMHHSGEKEPGYSMLRADHTPTPTYVSFVNALKWLSWTRRGDGRWFQISPGLHLALFCHGEKNAGAIWTTEGLFKLRLPLAPTRLTDHMGRSLPANDDGTVEASPAPVFFEWPDASALFDAEILPPVTLPPGWELSLPWNDALAGPGITVRGTTASFSPDAAPGEYSILGRTGDRFQVQPVQVRSPLIVDQVDFQVSPDGTGLAAVARVKSSLDERVEALMKLTLQDGSAVEARERLSPNVPTRMKLAVPGFEAGRRVQGKLVISLKGDVPFRLEKAVDQTVIVCPSLPQADWEAVAAVDISAWNPFPAALKPEDCSASLQTAVTPEGFRLCVEVRDDVHHQGQEIPSFMWNGDSIQFAFDVDADKEWQPNNVGNGYNGHRIFEYGVGLPSQGGNPMVWRWRADAPGFASGGEEPRVAAEVRRDGEKTVYDVLLPWETLGLAQPPAPGTNIGFALVVNDLDGAGDTRHGLRIFSGIMENKNPEGFGKLHVKEVLP